MNRPSWGDAPSAAALLKAGWRLLAGISIGCVLLLFAAQAAAADSETVLGAAPGGARAAPSKSIVMARAI